MHLGGLADGLMDLDALAGDSPVKLLLHLNQVGVHLGLWDRQRRREGRDSCAVTPGRKTDPQPSCVEGEGERKEVSGPSLYGLGGVNVLCGGLPLGLLGWRVGHGGGWMG